MKKARKGHKKKEIREQVIKACIEKGINPVKIYQIGFNVFMVTDEDDYPYKVALPV